MKTTTLSALAFVATVLPLAAQTASTTTAKPAVHHAGAIATTAHRVAGCSTLPTLSPKIPALPAGAACAKPLYTITRTPDMKLDYASPLLSPEVRESLGAVPATYSLNYADAVVGTGELVHQGKYLSVKYTGYLPDGTKFDSSEDHPGKEPIAFPYGMHRVIQGWDTGFEGMHVGGKRRLFIPYQLAYGEQGRPPIIPAKAMLVFDMEVVSESDNAPAPKAPPASSVHPVPPVSKPATPAGNTTQPASTAPKQ